MSNISKFTKRQNITNLTKFKTSSNLKKSVSDPSVSKAQIFNLNKKQNDCDISYESNNVPEYDYVSNYDVITIIGPQGAGKSTQLKKILEKIDVDFAPVGEILRSVLLGDGHRDYTNRKISPLLEQARKDMIEGKIIHDDITFEILKEYFKRSTKKPLLLFEGFPRTEYQVGHFYELSKMYHGREPRVAIIRLNIDKDLAHSRCVERASNLLKKGQVARPDDTDEAIQRRLQIYFEKMNILEKAFLEKYAHIHDFHSHEEIDVVHEKIMNKIIR